MGKENEFISDEHREYIDQQKMFFVCTAPLSGDGHINLSPKGFDCFRVLSPTKVGYLDIIGSGNETSAHLLENSRITFMFCSFDGPPKILRLYGKGYTVFQVTKNGMTYQKSLPSFRQQDRSLLPIFSK